MLRKSISEQRNVMTNADREDETSVALCKLAESDQALIRVVEDLVDTLIGKDLLRFTDLPEAAQAKLLERRNLRRSVNALNLLQDDDSKLI
jgi:hypothetical protein